MAEEVKLHSLAKTIRSLTDTEEFELAGYDQLQVIDLVDAAFKDPIPAENPFRVTFVVGGGKKVRQKFYPELPKDLNDALRAIGYVEDRGASACLECQGSFKYQHDTDKDLKFIHVIPRIQIIKEEDKSMTIGGVKLDQIGPEIKCTMCSIEYFQEMVHENCTSFSQKRALLKAMKQVVAKFDEFESRLAKLEKLEPNEEELYNGSVQLADKVAWLSDQVQGMVNKGKVTASEIEILIKEAQHKLQLIDENINKASSEGKKTTKLEEQKALLQTQIAKLNETQPIVNPRKHLDEIKALRLKIKTMKEERKDLHNIQIQEAQLEKLESSSKGWFWDSVPKEDQKEPKPKPKAPPKRGR